ncbi:hypothetical protein ACFXDH_21520 [Streptomyces sp. NPDC059467]|uniref:hypothetical protein n=1 Tax=Streptomyces sp. NPDC059467 TaxID=3346844 RepID=UPI0036B9107E
MAHEPHGGGPPQPDWSGDPAVMLVSLQTTHQLADGKAGILAGVQAALVVPFGPWARTARQSWAHSVLGSVLLDGLCVLFAAAFLGGVVCLALVLKPRLWQPASFNRYSVRALMDAVTVPPPGPAPQGGAGGDPAGGERAELWQACRFLAKVTVTKCRYTAAAVACTAVMATTAGLCLILRACPG